VAAGIIMLLAEDESFDTELEPGSSKIGMLSYWSSESCSQIFRPVSYVIEFTSVI